MRHSPGHSTDKLAIEPKKLVWTPELARRFWDYHSVNSETYFTSQFGKQLLRRLRNQLKKESVVLDYACGVGALSGLLLESGHKVAAADMSPESVAKVRAKYDGLPNWIGGFLVSELLKAGRKFDVIMLIEIIEHVDTAALASIIDDVRRLLRPGGLVVVTTPNEEDLSVETVYCPCCNSTFHRWQHVRSWSAGDVAKLFVDNGMVPLEVVATDLSLRLQDGIIRYVAKMALQKMRARRAPHLVGIARLSA